MHRQLQKVLPLANYMEVVVVHHLPSPEVADKEDHTERALLLRLGSEGKWTKSMMIMMMIFFEEFPRGTQEERCTA